MALLEVLSFGSFVFVVWFTWWAYHAVPGAGQTPRGAIFEAWMNIVTGFSVNYVANLLIIPMAMTCGQLTLTANWHMGWIFTAVSIVRQYVIRRWFNARMHALAVRIGGAK